MAMFVLYSPMVPIVADNNSELPFTDAYQTQGFANTAYGQYYLHAEIIYCVMFDILMSMSFSAITV